MTYTNRAAGRNDGDLERSREIAAFLTSARTHAERESRAAFVNGLDDRHVGYERRSMGLDSRYASYIGGTGNTTPAATPDIEPLPLPLR